MSGTVTLDDDYDDNDDSGRVGFRFFSNGARFTDVYMLGVGIYGFDIDIPMRAGCFGGGRQAAFVFFSLSLAQKFMASVSPNGPPLALRGCRTVQ